MDRWIGRLIAVGGTVLIAACGGDGGPPPVPDRPQAESRDFLYLSNLAAPQVDGRRLTTIEDQTAAVFDRLERMLLERGLDLDDVVAANVFLRDARDFAAMNAVYRERLGAAPPTRATVQAGLSDPDALVQLSVVAARHGNREVIEPAGLASPSLPYRWGIRVGNTVFVAGATSRDPETFEPQPGTVGTQVRRVFGNIGLVLAEAGLDYGDLVACKAFLADPRRFGEMNHAYREFFPNDDPPVRATVGARLVNPRFEVEIQCIADRDASRRVVLAEGATRPASPFSPGIQVGNRLYLAGMVGRGPDGFAPDAEGQTRQALANLRATLLAAGMDFPDVVDLWVFIADLRDAEAVHGVLAGLPNGLGSTGTVVGTPLMSPAARVEIMMTAERAESGDGGSGGVGGGA